MERVVFLLPDGTRVSCMLNPASVIVRRRAGIVQRASGTDSIVSTDSDDDPLLYTGGGSTELILELLFDLAVAGSSLDSTDVRSVTGPLWRLTESAHAAPGPPKLPVVRFIWGKAWNVPGVIAEVAERLEAFDAGGAPRRSLMTLRFVRVSDDGEPSEQVPPLDGTELEVLNDSGFEDRLASSEAIEVADQFVGGRADVVAERLYGSESLWRLVLAPNGITEPAADLTGRALTLPPRSILGRRRD